MSYFFMVINLVVFSGQGFDTPPGLVVMQHGKVVDQGTRDEVMNHPTSDYTKKLLAAVPEMEGQRYV